MPLTTCPDCEKEVSDAAPACIHCGRPMTLEEPREPPRRELPVLEGSINAECGSCGALMDDPHVWSGGPVDCPSCGARYLFTSTREPERPFNPGVAAVLSLVIPGAGQMYRNRLGTGLGWLLTIGTLYLTIPLLAPPLHIICIFGAGSRS